jgi:hypothetical protein
MALWIRFKLMTHIIFRATCFNKGGWSCTKNYLVSCYDNFSGARMLQRCSMYLRRAQGCQIFLSTIYQSGEKYTTTKLPNAHKIYPMVVNYSKWPKNIKQHFNSKILKNYAQIAILGLKRNHLATQVRLALQKNIFDDVRTFLLLCLFFGFGGSHVREKSDQGCQNFLDTIYQNGGKCAKMPLNDVPNGQNKYQMAVIYSKWP